MHINPLLQKVAEMYHGSPKKIKTLKPKNLHGDPGIPDVVFGTKFRDFALPYAGKKWSDLDITQEVEGNRNSKWKQILTEMRPGAFNEMFKGKSGYLHKVSPKGFKERNTHEHISTKKVKPHTIEKIKDVYSALVDAGVEMRDFDANSKHHGKMVKFRKDRMKEMEPDKREQYVNWIKSNAHPSLTKAMFGKSAEYHHYMPESAVADVKKHGIKGLGKQLHENSSSAMGRLSSYSRFLPKGQKPTKENILKAMRKTRKHDKGEDFIYGLPSKWDAGESKRHGKKTKWMDKRVGVEVMLDKLKKDKLLLHSDNLDAKPINYKKIDDKITFKNTPHPSILTVDGVVPPKYLKFHKKANINKEARDCFKKSVEIVQKDPKRYKLIKGKAQADYDTAHFWVHDTHTDKRIDPTAGQYKNIDYSGGKQVSLEKNKDYIDNIKKASTKWVKPKVKHEYGEYFDNDQTKQRFNDAGMSFGKKKQLHKYLKQGTPKSLSSLGDVDNVSDEKDFKKQLKDKEYKARYELLKSKKKQHMPIVVNLKDKNYLFSGNRRLNLARENKEDPKVWHISNIKKKASDESVAHQLDNIKIAKHKHTYITGAPGSGKSTLARNMSKKTGRPVINIDDIVSQGKDWRTKLR